MLNSSFKLGRLAGIEVGINISLLFMALLVMFSMADGYFPVQIPNHSHSVHLILGAITALLICLSVLWHEMAHALMARFFGLTVRRVVLFMFGGMAEIEQEPRSAKQEFWIALIGPLSSAILGLVTLGGTRVADAHSSVGALLLWVGYINLMLAAFNMLPGFPLDGGRVLRAIIWYASKNHLRATSIATRSGQVFASIFVGVGMVDILDSGGVAGSLWLIFIGWFLWSAAQSQLRIARVQDLLKNIFLKELLNPQIQLETDWPLPYAMDVMSLHGAKHSAPVFKDQRIVGIFEFESILKVSHFDLNTIKVEHLMQSLNGLPKVSINDAVFDTLRRLELDKVDYAIVTDNTIPVGVIGKNELLLVAYRRKRELDPLAR